MEDSITLALKLLGETHPWEAERGLAQWAAVQQLVQLQANEIAAHSNYCASGHCYVAALLESGVRKRNDVDL